MHKNMPEINVSPPKSLCPQTF